VSGREDSIDKNGLLMESRVPMKADGHALLWVAAKRAVGVSWSFILLYFL